jgi:hypothetical protein
VNQFGEGWEDGSSSRVLSMVAWVSQRGTVAVVRTRGHPRRLAGSRGSGRRWGPRGGEIGGGRWPEMVAISEATSAEMAHDVGRLRGLLTAVGSRQKRRLKTVLLLSGVAWALEGVGVGCSSSRGEW